METYIIQFNPDKTKGVYGISLVENPAIEELFIQMSKETEVKMTVVDEEKRLFMTPVLIPNQKILRLKKDGTPYNIVFEKDVIQMAQQNFQKQGFQNNSTLEHDINVKLDGVTFVESWVKEDEVHDKSLMKGFKHPIGTWFTIFKVDDDVVLSKIKSGEIKGVSIDGAFEIDENFKLNTMNVETILTAIKDGFKSLTVKLSSEKTTDEKEVFFEGKMEAGTEMFSDAEMTMPLEDGTYKFTDHNAIIEGGKVKEIVAVEMKKEAEEKLEMSNAEEVLSKVMAILETYSVEMAKEVSNQLAEFKTELKKEEVKNVVVEEVSLTAPKPVHTEVEPKTLKEKLLKEMSKNN